MSIILNYEEKFFKISLQKNRSGTLAVWREKLEKF